MDRSGANFFETVQQMKDILGANPIAIQIPIGAEENFKGVVDLIKMKAILWHDETMGAEYDVEEIPADLADEAAEWRDKLLEGAANFDDEVMELYLDGQDIPEEKLLAAIRKGCCAMECCPMLLGSSYKNKGVQPLLDYVCAFLPSPMDTPNITGTNPDTEEEEDRKPSEDEPTSALAFKIATDPFMGRLVFFRVYSGKVVAGSYVYNPRSGKRERISRLFQMNSKQDLTYVANDAANNSALSTSELAPATGWEFKPAATEGYFVIVSGTVQFNQTNFGNQNYPVYNWGSGTNTTDTGCQYAFLLVGEESTPTGITAPLSPTGGTAAYDLSGRRVDNPTRGLYIVNGQKRAIVR